MASSSRWRAVSGASSTGSRRPPGSSSSTSECEEPNERCASRRTARSCNRLYATTPTTAAAPSTSRPSCRSVMATASGREFLPDAQRFLDIHRDDPGHAGLRHGDADQLLGHLHRDLVVADEQELRLRRHLAYQVAEALRVAVVEWCIDLVEQAKRRRVELKQRKDERDRRERLLAARKQVDAGVALAGGMRHHLHAGVEDFLAGHDQLRLAAAEQRGEQHAEMLVHHFEGLAQQLARLAVDLADRVLKGAHRLLEVRGLRVKEALALLARRQFLERGEVDRAKLVDRLRKPRNLALQRRSARCLLRFGGQQRLVGVRLAQLGRVLLRVQLGRLLLQLELAQPLS